MDQVEDPAWASAADERCAVAMDLIDALPVASTRESPIERAADIEAGTAALRSMLDEIEAIPLSTDDDVVSEWIADYRTYIDDRDRYSQQLRDGIDERFGVSISDNGDPIDRRLNGFATANDMGRCFVPQDV